MNEQATTSPPPIQPLKILHTCATLQAGTLGSQMLHIAQYATTHNHMSYVACASQDEAAIEKLLRAGGMHLPTAFDTPSSLFKAPIEGFRLAAHIREHNIDLIHAHDTRTLVTALWASRFSRVPVVVQANSLKTPPRVLRAANGVIVPSKYMAAQLGVPDAHILPPCYDPVDLHAKDIDATAVDGLWAEWDVPSATSVILITEPLVEDSGYRQLIEAFGQMKNLPFKAIICANYQEQQPLFTDLWSRIDALGLGKEILFIEKPTTPKALKNVLSASDVVAFPNPHAEAEAQSVVNAQAMGKPVVVHSPGNRAEVVDSGKTGWLVNLENPDMAANKLSLALKDAITDMTRLQKMGTTATRHCKEHYATARVCSDLFDFYQHIRHAKTNDNNL